jgi:hypothetical protein
MHHRCCLFNTVNRQKLNSCRFYFYIIHIQSLTNQSPVFKKPTPPSKERQLCGCRAFVSACPTLDASAPALRYGLMFPEQVPFAGTKNTAS